LRGCRQTACATTSGHEVPTGPRAFAQRHWSNVVRDAAAAGDHVRAWDVMELLMVLISASVETHVRRQGGLSRAQQNDIQEELSTVLYTEWQSLEPCQEFWEVRFWVCLKRRLFDLVRRRSRDYLSEVSLETLESNGQAGRDAIEEVVATASG